MKLYPNITLIFFCWLIAILTIFYFGFSTLPKGEATRGDFWQSLANWDGGHYLSIAEFGYKEKFQYAFFPLYPVTIKLVQTLTNNYLLAALIISGLSSYFAIQLLYNLALLDFKKQIAQKVIFWLLFFPTSFYFLTAYSEGLFLYLVLACIFFLRRGNLILATMFAAFASATRLTGLALVLGLWAQVLLSSGFNKKNWFVTLAPAGFLVYSWYLFTTTGDPFYFIRAEGNWQRSLAFPGLSFWESLQSLSIPGFIATNFNALLDLLFAIFGLGMAIRAFRFLPPSYSIYSLISVILPLTTPTLQAMPRYILPIFPIFILIALWKNQNLLFFYKLVSVMLLAAFAILFINGYFVS